MCGLVGKGSPGAEPCIDLDTMLDLTAKAEVNGVKFDGVDLFLYDPHTSIDIGDDGIKALADKIRGKGFVVGSVVAPVWPPTGGGSAMGGDEDRKKFVASVGKACRIAKKLREFGVRPYGIVRIDSAAGVTDWDKDPKGNTKLIAKTFREAPRSPKITANGWRRRARFAGAACTVGNTCSRCWSKSDSRAWSVSKQTWRIRFFTCSATTRRSIASCRRSSTGSTTSSTRR